MTSKLISLALALFCCIVFQAIFSLANMQQYRSALAQAADAVQVRIALDLSNLELANPRLNIVADKDAIQDYLNSINQHLDKQSANVKVLALDKVVTTSEPSPILQSLELQTPDRNIMLELGYTPWSFLQSLSPVPFLLAIMFTGICYRFAFMPAQTTSGQERLTPIKWQVRLVINLHQKTVSNGLDDIYVKLSNKPFCFYAALVDYCLTHTDPKLSHGNDVPDDILNLANRYFYRLIELGHTKRKKPDFSTNLDKTLSEIRAGLDEVYAHRSDEKAVFYPPKAQGEGSRSKLHNYALKDLTADLVEFIGK